MWLIFHFDSNLFWWKTHQAYSFTLIPACFGGSLTWIGLPFSLHTGFGGKLTNLSLSLWFQPVLVEHSPWLVLHAFRLCPVSRPIPLSVFPPEQVGLPEHHPGDCPSADQTRLWPWWWWGIHLQQQPADAVGWGETGVTTRLCLHAVQQWGRRYRWQTLVHWRQGGTGKVHAVWVDITWHKAGGVGIGRGVRGCKGFLSFCLYEWSSWLAYAC